MQGKLKAKRLSATVASLSSPEKFLGPYAGNKTVTRFSGLAEGANPECVFMGAVVAMVATQDRVPW